MLIHRSEALLILIYQLQIHTNYPNYHKLDFIKTSSLYSIGALLKYSSRMKTGFFGKGSVPPKICHTAKLNHIGI